MEFSPVTRTIALLLDDALNIEERKQAFRMLANNDEARELFAMCVKALDGNRSSRKTQFAQDRDPSRNNGAQWSNDLAA